VARGSDIPQPNPNPPGAEALQVFMYQARKVLADEVPFEVDAACPLPLSLPNVTRPLPPCSDAVRALLAPLEALAPPPPVKAPPPRLPKVPSGHVNRAAGVPAFLVTGEEAEGGLVSTIVQKPPPEQRVIAPTWEESVFKQHKSVFAPRRRDADSRAYTNGKKVYERAFALDFGMLQIKSGLTKAVGGPEVMLAMREVRESPPVHSRRIASSATHTPRRDCTNVTPTPHQRMHACTHPRGTLDASS